MLFFAGDEHDEDRDDDQEDADFEDNSENDEDDSDEEDEDEESDDSEESDEDSEDEDEDNKPVTRKEMRDLIKSLKNDRNAGRRVSSKKGDRTTRQPSDADKRLSTVEKQLQETQLIERKRSFGYENNLSPKQVNYVFRLTKRPTSGFLNKPHVKAALDAIKAQENVARNTPSGSGKRGTNNGGKKYTDLKPEERQAGFADRRREILASKQR